MNISFPFFKHSTEQISLSDCIFNETYDSNTRDQIFNIQNTHQTQETSNFTMFFIRADILLSWSALNIVSSKDSQQKMNC